MDVEESSTRLNSHTDDECIVVYEDQAHVEESFIGLDSQISGDYNVVDEDQVHETYKPVIGMEFDTIEAAYDFYNQYSLKTGFGTRKSTSYRSRTNGHLIGRLFVCNKAGCYKPKEDEEHTVKRKGSTLVGCQARMKVSITASSTWRISLFVEEHTNHELTSPSKTGQHRSHKKEHLHPEVRSIITALHNEGIRNATIGKSITAIVGSNVEIVSSQQVSDHLRVARKNNVGKNCQLLIQHLSERRNRELGFYFSHELDENNTFRSVFWADERSQTSYDMFSDVIIFDVTYRTNNLQLPFAPFTGINHHRQSILFGCALLADEKEDTFVWLFTEWLKCMGGKEPGAIITDQDAAIGNAIKRVFPNTRHRYCDWHLDKNIGEHRHQLETRYGTNITTDFQQLRDSRTILEAEQRWVDFSVKYPMEEKSWLPKLWARRERWVPCYLRDVFLARCRSSQRAESINAFFDHFVTSSTPVNEFVMQYEKAVASRRRAEERADFNTMNKNPILCFDWKLEETAARSYTKAIFKDFKEELANSKKMCHALIEKKDNIVKYIVGRMSSDRSKWKNVIYNNSNGILVSCQCKQFESEGILCRHALNILWQELVTDLPDHYILKRWTIDSRHRGFDFSTSSGGTQGHRNKLSPQMYFNLRNMCNIVMEESCHSMEVYDQFHSFLSGTIGEINKRKTEVQPCSYAPPDIGSLMPLVVDISEQDPATTIYDPKVRQHKGRPGVAARKKGAMELSQELQKKGRRCSYCNKIEGHNYRTCPDKAADDAAAKASATAFEGPTFRYNSKIAKIA